MIARSWTLLSIFLLLLSILLMTLGSDKPNYGRQDLTLHTLRWTLREGMKRYVLPGVTVVTQEKILLS